MTLLIWESKWSSPGILSDLHRRLLDAGGGHVLLHLPGGPIRQQGALHAQLQHLHMKDGNGHFLVATPANTGLRRNDPAADGGVGDVTLPDADLGSFKSPSLRKSTSPSRTVTTADSQRSKP
jgi:hypothetical protein